MQGNYVILSTRVEETYISTTVQYNENLTIDVFHFNPASVEEIHQNIVNRGLTEMQKIIIKEQLDRIVNEIPVGETINF
jgi:hypothetical protein